jgi:hypothetical protein
MVHSRLYGSVALLALALAAPAAPAANVEWTRFVDEYIEAHFVAQPATAVTKGRHEFDGPTGPRQEFRRRSPDWSRRACVR